jgi:hypothetical protein
MSPRFEQWLPSLSFRPISEAELFEAWSDHQVRNDATKYGTLSGTTKEMEQNRIPRRKGLKTESEARFSKSFVIGD